MGYIIYLLALGLFRFIQLWPVAWVAQTGRCAGAAAYWVDRRRRRLALTNLSHCFGKEMNPAQIRALAKEHYRRLGENYLSALKTALLSPEKAKMHVQIEGIEKLTPILARQGVIVAIGHFGNFELYTRVAEGFSDPSFVFASTYRALWPPQLNQFILNLRSRTGCLFFERTSQAAELKQIMGKPGVILGLLADQHAGSGGVWGPFLGRVCSTSAAPALFALRYKCALFTGICHRIGLAQWKIQLGEEIPTIVNGSPRTKEEITADMNKTFEQAVRRDPANWFWVHNRWKPRRRHGKTEALSTSTGPHE